MPHHHKATIIVEDHSMMPIVTVITTVIRIRIKIVIAISMD